MRLRPSPPCRCELQPPRRRGEERRWEGSGEAPPGWRGRGRGTPPPASTSASSRAPSARNLFSGKDILGQISEFYDELKRMVGGGCPVTDTQEEYSSNPMNPSDLMEKVSPDASVSNPVPADTVKEVARQETVKKSPSPMKGKKVGLKVEAGKQRSPSVLKEVKATPPTPQRFPSPSPNRIKNVKPGGVATAGSPLKKPLKEKGTPSKDLESKKDGVRQPFGVKDMNNTRACDAEGSSSSMFWFLKPCTFLVE